MNKQIAAIILSAIILGLGGFLFYRQTGQKISLKNDKLQIVTTFLPMFVFTKNIAGDFADVKNLLPQGAGPHDYSFAPSDVQKIAEADVIIKHGRGIDDWLDKMIEAAGKSDLTVVVASDNIEPHTGAPIYDIGIGPATTNANQLLVVPDKNDSHIWVDPFLAIKEVENIRNSLMKKDPAHAEEYARNAEEYLLKLMSLDSEIRQALSPLQNRKFIAYHLSFGYFAYEYGLEEVAAIEEIPGQEPSPTELVSLIKKMKNQSVKVIFSEPQFSPKIVETIASDYKIKILQVDPLETGELRADYYEEVMRKNVSAIAEAMSE